MMMNEPLLQPPHDPNQRTIMIVVYVLFGLGVIFGGLPAIAGVILAYIKRQDMLPNSLYHNHLTFLIRTFWGSVAGTVIGFILSFIGIGILVLFAVGIWYLFRVIYGFVKLMDEKSITTTGWFV
jgi:Predicted membrane protein